MPFDRPPLAELIERGEAEVAARLELAPLLPNSVLSVLARVLAGSSHGMHGHLDFNGRQVVPLTAEGADLDRHVDLFGQTRRGATAAFGFVDFTGTNGSNVPLGLTLTRADGRRFKTTASAVISGSAATVAVQDDLPGLAGDTAPSTPLSLSTPVAGVATATVDADGLAGGQDAETDQDLRDRFREFVSARPQGGSVADYVTWSKEVGGVTRVFVRPGYQGLGTVGVFVVTDDDPLGPIPSPALVAEVQARIDDPTRRDSRPVTAQVTVYAPTEVPTAFTLHVEPDVQSVRDAVTEALRDMLRASAEPGATLKLNKVNEAISTSPGEEDHVLAVPAADLATGPAELRTLGTVTFT